MKSILLALLTAVLLLVAAAPEVAALEEWCEDDPLVLITTPGGNVAPVYVTNGALGTEHLPAVQLATISHTVHSVDGGRATLVRMTVVVPNDAFGSHFPTRTTASSGPMKSGTIYDTDTGYSGEPMHLSFRLNVP